MDGHCDRCSGGCPRSRRRSAGLGGDPIRKRESCQQRRHRAGHGHTRSNRGDARHATAAYDHVAGQTTHAAADHDRPHDSTCNDDEPGHDHDTDTDDHAHHHDDDSDDDCARHDGRDHDRGRNDDRYGDAVAV